MSYKKDTDFELHFKKAMSRLRKLINLYKTHYTYQINY